MAYLGFDTSNYTTSAALYIPEKNLIIHKKRLLPVKSGEKGIRQSDAVFHHTVQLSQIFDELLSEAKYKIDSVGASAFPRMAEGSYMPCFLVGLNTGRILARSENIPFFESSHQIGHILAALYSCERMELINERFIAFHLSGGTTEALLVEPDEKEIIKCTVIGRSLDLKAGQAIDRAGVMLGMNFPCGAELDRLSHKSDKKFKIKPSLKGCDVSLSGLENKCRLMCENGDEPCDIARFCIEYINVSLDKMTEAIIKKFGNLPLVYSGGVMSNSIIRSNFRNKYNALFAAAEFSADNAAGIAVMAYLKSRRFKTLEEK